MITLIGTGHVFDLDYAVNLLLDEKKPSLVCVELDKTRYRTLSARTNDSNKYKKARKSFPIVYKLFAIFQERVAKKNGVNPGDEMLAAVNYAKNKGLPFEFIDVNSNELYRRLIDNLSLYEKLKLSILAVFLTVFGRYLISSKKINKELTNLDDDFEHYMKRLGQEYPIVKRLLLDERNEHMAKKIMCFEKKHTNIVACIGDGHVKGVSDILQSNNIKFEIVRLNYLLKKYNNSAQ
jgi:pheromone shutdown protein TraB